MEDDINVIKSLIAISSGGLLLKEIPGEFREMNGTSLDYRKYGFSSIEEMLLSSKQIVLWNSPSGMRCRVNDSKMSHVTSLVEKAKKPRKKRSSMSRPRPSYYNPSRVYSSPQRRYGVRSSEPFGRQPFRPVNRQFDTDHRRTSRPQSVGRVPSTSATTSSSKNTYNNSRYQSNSSSSKNTYNNSRYQSNTSSACNFERSNRVERKPVQSSMVGSTVGKQKTDDSSSGWSDSSGTEEPQILLSSVGWTSKSAVGKPEAEVKRLMSNLSSQTVSKAQAVGVRSREAVCVPAANQVPKKGISSGSDWSSLNSGSASSLTDIPEKTMKSGIKYSPVSLQNGAVSSTSKLNMYQSKMTEPGKPQLKTKSDSSSDWTDSSGHEEPLHISSPPLMVGGVGRGKLRHQVDVERPGKNEHQVPSPKGGCSNSTDVIVTGSPCKREASNSMKNGMSTILIKVRNEPAIPIRKPQESSKTLQNSIVAHYQFIGDFLLRRVAEVTLGKKFPENRGLCRSNSTILDCIVEVQRTRTSSRPIILMIGMTDILNGATFEEMQKHTTLLLRKLSTNSIVLLTLPVPPAFIKIGFENKLSVLEKYNRWLLSLSLPTKIETEQYLYCDLPFYTRTPRFEVETFSEAGCWVVMDEIIGVI